MRLRPNFTSTYMFPVSGGDGDVLLALQEAAEDAAAGGESAVARGGLVAVLGQARGGGQLLLRGRHGRGRGHRHLHLPHLHCE